MEAGTTNLNFNATECLARTFDFGGTTIRNICSGSQTFVPWGSLDWVGVCALLAGGTIILLLVLVMLIRMTFDWY